MPAVQFTANLTRQTNAPACFVAGKTVREALDHVFADHPALRGYILDDQNEVRPHVVVFVDGTSMKDRCGLSDSVNADSEIFVMQALSGG